MWLAMAIGAGIGAIVGGFSTGIEKYKQKKELERQQQAAEAAYREQKALADRQYELQKGEALYQLDEQYRALNEGMGQFTDDYNARMLARAYGEQDARIQTASGIGESYVGEGMGGTRGNDANRLMRAYAADSTEKQIALQRKQDENILASTMQNADRSVAAMEHEKASWQAGGYRDEAKAAGDYYNKKMFDMQQAEYQNRLDQYDWGKNFWGNLFDYGVNVIGGASTGMDMGMGIYDYKSKWGKPKTETVIDMKYTGPVLGYNPNNNQANFQNMFDIVRL